MISELISLGNSCFGLFCFHSSSLDCVCRVGEDLLRDFDEPRQLAYLDGGGRVQEQLVDRLPPGWPDSWPTTHVDGFWMQVLDAEIRLRDQVSMKVAKAIDEGWPPEVDKIEAWLIRRRAEWATQLAAHNVVYRKTSSAELSEVLYAMLIDSWSCQGCHAFGRFAREMSNQNGHG